MHCVEIIDLKTNSRILVLLMTVLFCFRALAANIPAQIGNVELARGAVSAQYQGGEVRVLGRKSPLYSGDVITTGSKSFAVIKLNDESRFSLRPETVFSVEDYSEEQGQESAVMRLFKGGMRVITGFIGKRKPESYKLATSVATIGIRGTEFDARLCSDDCASEDKEIRKANANTSVGIARIAYLKGQATAVNTSGEQRILNIGSAVFVGDLLETGKDSFIVLAFRDESRVTLRAETQFKIEEHKYSPDAQEENKAVYQLIKGGFRALTGLISKYNKNAYKVRTPTATIGIRGTGFDLVWLGACGVSANCGLVGFVWNGSIFAENDSGVWNLQENEVFRIRFPDQPAEFLNEPPAMHAPRPDKVDINLDEFLGKEDKVLEPGLYVGCISGFCTMTQDKKTIILAEGEYGFGKRDPSVLTKVVRNFDFLTNDRYLKIINLEMEIIELFELHDDSVIDQNEFECIIQ